MFIEVSEPGQTGDARRKAVACAEDLHIKEERRGAIAVATTEMATNLVKHAGGGYIVVQPLFGAHAGLRIISVDKGPGIADVPRALSDGHSTAGSMGTGLGAIRRMADAFEIYSVVSEGTVICADFRAEKASRSAQSAMEVGLISEPIAGEDVSGDGWGMKTLPDGALFMVVDGLGHGVLASDAAREAERIFAEGHEQAPGEIIQSTHLALRATRGAAIGVARLNLEKGLLTYAGVGNISSSIVSPGASRGMASHNGILGHNMQRVQEFTFPWNGNSMLIMHSDGLATRWDLQKYPGIGNKPASVIAAVLHRDFSRKRDDVTVLVAKLAA